MNEISSQTTEFQHPWLVAVWPGMGHVAINAGVYLLSQLGMEQYAEIPEKNSFDIDHVLIEEGLVQPIRNPRNRLFVWRDPDKKRDLLLFIGEAQPTTGKLAFCRILIDLAAKVRVEKVFTFAAMATAMNYQNPSQVFGVTTDVENLLRLREFNLGVLNDGQIGGLNGILLGAALEKELPAVCLLGEIPQSLSAIPFPKASEAILRCFGEMAEIKIDFTELTRIAEESERQIDSLVEQINRSRELPGEPQETEDELNESPPEEPRLSSEDEAEIERLFEESGKDRSRAFVLKQKLDQLGLFKDYEDRFLDLFKKQD